MAEATGTARRRRRRRRPRTSVSPGYVETTTSARRSAISRRSPRPPSATPTIPARARIGATAVISQWVRSNSRLPQTDSNELPPSTTRSESRPIAASPSASSTSIAGSSSARPAASHRAGRSCPSPIAAESTRTRPLVAIGARTITGVSFALDEADLPVGLQDREADLVERADLLEARGGGELFERHALAPQVVLDRLAVDDEHDRLALQQRAEPPDPERRVRRRHGEQRERDDDRRRAGQRVVALGDALLHEVADDDEQDEVEGLHRAQLAPADHAREQQDEEEDVGRAEDEVHNRRLGQGGQGPRDVCDRQLGVVELDVEGVAAHVGRVDLELHPDA